MQKLKGEVIAIGDEITTGQRVDTNTQWLSSQLIELGIDVIRHTTIGDEMADNVDAFRSSADRADVIIVTGGLGPTADDLTRDALAEAAGVPLVEDARSLERIEAMFRKSGREMPPQNRRQAEFPEGAKPIDNSGGTAPGVDFTFPKKNSTTKSEARFFCLPGVPVEKRQMWRESVRPALEAMTAEQGVTRHYLVRCFGVGESRLEQMLPNIISRDHYPRVGITATKGTLTLRLFASEANEEACYAVMEPTLATLREKLGPLIFTEGRGDAGEIDLHEVVLSVLAEKQESLAVVESMTGGLLNLWLTEAEPERGQFVHGEIRRQPCETVEEAERLAAMVRKEQDVEYAIMIGTTMPVSSSNDPIRVPIAVATPTKTISKEVTMVGHPSIHRPIVAKHALNLLRYELQGL